jgi:hypothetical protein
MAYLNVEIPDIVHIKLNLIKEARGGTPLYTLTKEAIEMLIKKHELKFGPILTEKKAG